MIANVLNTILGVWFVYAAVLNSPLMLANFRYVGIGGGVLVIALSLLARRSDYHPWHSNVVIFLGLALIVMGAVNVFDQLPLVVNYWTAFWSGVLISFLSLWVAFYRPANVA